MREWGTTLKDTQFTASIDFMAEQTQNTQQQRELQLIHVAGVCRSGPLGWMTELHADMEVGWFDQVL